MSWVMVAVGATSAFNQVQAGRYAKGQANLLATQDDWQARIAQRDALATAEVIRRAGRRQVGQVVAGYAGAGVKVGEGSAAEAERQVTQDYQHDAFQAILQGDRRALGFQTEAQMARAQGRAAQTAGWVSAGGSLLSAGYQIGQKWNTLAATGDGLSQGDRRKLGVF